MATSIHNVYAVKHDAAVIGGITTANCSTGTEVEGEGADGAVSRRIQSVRAQKPAGTFTTMALKAALDAIGLLGSAIAGAGFSMYGYKHADGGTRATGSVHRELLLNKGIIIPRRLTMEHQGDAQLEYQVIVVYDGVNDPIVINNTVALPTDPNDNTRFTIGKTTIGGVAIENKRRVEIDFGITAQSEGVDSEVWDTIVTISDVNPVVTISGIDKAWLDAANIPLLGKAATHANSVIYCRKRADGGTFVPDITAEHIKFDLAGLCVVTDDNTQHNQPGETTLRISTKHDGSNDPLVVNTASAIN